MCDTFETQCGKGFHMNMWLRENWNWFIFAASNHCKKKNHERQIHHHFINARDIIGW
jgi:hypothetical protein